MTTIDQLLLKIVNFTEPTIEEQLASRDSRVLRSLATSVLNTYFITENQSKLLTKILRENAEKLTIFKEEIRHALSAPLWSRQFRQIEQVKKFYISKNYDQELCLTIEFTFSSEIRKILQNLSKNVDGLNSSESGKIWTSDLTEQNIVLLVEALSPLDFEIDEIIKNHFSTIKSWSKTDIENQFLLTNIEHRNFQQAITDDLGIETAINRHIINDRSVRYQYFTENPKNPGETLTEYIANRAQSRVWINKEEHRLTSVIESLINLKRLPVMIVFDNISNDKYLKNLEILKDALEENGIWDNVGIYFRLQNDESGKQFNQLIADKKYNYQLDNTTCIAGVVSGKIPKFFLKTTWTPMSVIALDTRMGLRHGKTSVYANCCDLIIEWADEPTMFDNKVILR